MHKTGQNAAESQLLNRMNFKLAIFLTTSPAFYGAHTPTPNPILSTEIICSFG